MIWSARTCPRFGSGRHVAPEGKRRRAAALQIRHSSHDPSVIASTSASAFSAAFWCGSASSGRSDSMRSSATFCFLAAKARRSAMRSMTVTGRVWCLRQARAMSIKGQPPTSAKRQSPFRRRFSQIRVASMCLQVPRPAVRKSGQVQGKGAAGEVANFHLIGEAAGRFDGKT